MRKAEVELAEELCRVANSRFKLWLENKNLLEAPEDVVDVLENAPDGGHDFDLLKFNTLKIARALIKTTRGTS